MKRLDHGSDIPVFEDQALALLCLSKHNIHHCPAQIVSANYLVRKQQSKHGIERPYHPVTEIRFLSRLHRVDVRGPEKINARKTSREQCLLRLALVASEGKPASSRRVRATPAQERERTVRTAITKHSRELDRIVGGYDTQLLVRYRSGVRPQAIDHRVLVREYACERGTVCEVLMQNLFELGVADAKFLAP